MFDSISPWYDFLNHLLSLNIDRYWRYKAINLLSIDKNCKRILDLAMGTGDVYRILEKKYGHSKIFGLDFSFNMLKRAKQKIEAKNIVLADIYARPFKDESFDRIITAFGFRNFPDKPTALKTINGLLKRNGIFCILELAPPDKNKLFRSLFNFYFKNILPFIGGIVSKNYGAYLYLPTSVYNFPKKEELKRMIYAANFKKVEYHSMTFGLCNAILCYK